MEITITLTPKEMAGWIQLAWKDGFDAQVAPPMKEGPSMPEVHPWVKAEVYAHRKVTDMVRPSK